MCQAYGGECLFAEWPWHLQLLQQAHKNMQQSLQRYSSVAKTFILVASAQMA
jgi:hypothetical protein